MERLATDMIHVLNSGEMNVFRLGLLLLLAGHDVFRMWINQCIPDGRIEARWIACVRRASVCCVRIIRVFHGPVYVRHAEVREPWIVSGCPVCARKAELNWNHSPGA
jgi:hypothetical protein